MEPERIIALRKRMGLSIQNFAVQLGCSFTAVCGWEKGRFKPNAENLSKLKDLAAFYGI